MTQKENNPQYEETAPEETRSAKDAGAQSLMAQVEADQIADDDEYIDEP